FLNHQNPIEHHVIETLNDVLTQMDPMLIKPVLYHPPPEAWSRHYSLASHNPALKISYEYRSAYNQTFSSHSDHDYPIVRLLYFLPFREDYGQRVDSLDPLPVQ